MKKVLIWFSGENKNKGFVKWVQFLKWQRKLKARKMINNLIEWKYVQWGYQHRAVELLYNYDDLPRNGQKEAIIFQKLFLHNQPTWCCKWGCMVLRVTFSHACIYIMSRNYALAYNIAYTPSCIKCTDTSKKLHQSFDFGNNIICPHGIGILTIHFQTLIRTK